MTAVFAHRGCTLGCVENTLDAFAQARRLGAQGVELDVRLTADGALAVHHDAEIDGVGLIAELRVAELPDSVPLLAEALAVCEGMVVNVEIKNAPGERGWDPGEVAASTAAATIDELGWTERVIVSSFQVTTLHATRAADSRLALGWLWGLGARPGPALAQASAAGFRAVHPFVGMVDPGLVDRAHATGLAVNVWGVNAAADLRAMVQAGVDVVITDQLADALMAVAEDG